MDSVMARFGRFLKEPPIDINAIIQSMGIQTDWDARLHPDIVGQIEKDGGLFRISIQGSDHENRKRFTAAHELGHYLFHRDILDDGVDDDKMYRSKNVGRFYNRSIKQYHETEANNFAAKILMPAHLVGSWHNRRNGDLKQLARDFKVSPKSMRIRLQSLGLPYHE